MDYRIRSKKDRKIEWAVKSTMTYSTFAGHLQGPNSKPGEAVKAMPDGTREKLKQARAKHFQNYPVKHE